MQLITKLISQLISQLVPPLITQLISQPIPPARHASPCRARALSVLALYALAGLALAGPGCASSTSTTARERALRDALAESARPPDTPSAISLEPRALARAVVERNPSLAAARAAWAAAAHAPDAIMGPEPMLALRAAPASLTSPFRTDEHKPPIGVEVMAEAPIVISGRLDAERAAALADAEGAGADYTALKLELASAAAALACDAWELDAVTDVNEHHAGLFRSMRAAARDAVASGRGSVDDALAIDDEIFALDGERLTVTSERAIVQARINALLHRDPRTPLPARASVSAPPVVMIARATTPAPVVAAGADHPLVVGAERRADAATARVDRAERERLPNVKLVAGYSTMWEHPEHNLVVGVAFDLPIYDGARGADVKRMKAEREMATYGAQDRRDQVAAEARIAELRVDEIGARLALLEGQRAPLAKRRAESARSSIAGGAGALVDALRASVDEWHALLDVARARAELCRREVALLRARGDEGALLSSSERAEEEVSP